MNEKIWPVLREWAFPVEIDANDARSKNFAVLGFDSLDMIELAAIIEGEFDIPAPPVDEDWTAAGLAERINFLLQNRP